MTLNSTRARLYTRELYATERLLMKHIEDVRPFVADTPIAELRRIALRLCGNTPGIVVKAGRGVPGGVSLVSCAQGPKIVLARHQRSVFVLIHEVAHVLGSDREYDHGPAFRRRFVGLLVDYCKAAWPLELL